MRNLNLFFLCGLFLFTMASLFAAIPPDAPDQPPYGPGGYSYPHAAVNVTRIGAHEDKYYLFEPASPRPVSAPVVIFLHGWLYSHPDLYRAWIDHLAKSGHIVIFPCYQNAGEPVDHFFANTVRSIKDALVKLVDGTHIEPDRERVFCIGHEGGGVLAVDYAASARYFQLPVPKALAILMPSRVPGEDLANRLPLYDLSKISPETLLHVVVGDDDLRNGNETAREIFFAADLVPVRNKEFITFVSDMRGTPALIADRFAPLCPILPLHMREIDRRRLEFIHLYKEKFSAREIRCQAVDAHDWLGFWRLFDSLVLAAHSREARGLALGESPELLDMGAWSDGRPVLPLLSTKRP